MTSLSLCVDTNNVTTLVIMTSLPVSISFYPGFSFLPRISIPTPDFHGYPGFPFLPRIFFSAPDFHSYPGTSLLGMPFRSYGRSTKTTTAPGCRRTWKQLPVGPVPALWKCTRPWYPALPCPALPCPALPCPALPCPSLLYFTLHSI